MRGIGTSFLSRLGCFHVTVSAACDSKTIGQSLGWIVSTVFIFKEVEAGRSAANGIRMVEEENLRNQQIAESVALSTEELRSALVEMAKCQNLAVTVTADGNDRRVLTVPTKSASHSLPDIRRNNVRRTVVAIDHLRL